MHSDNDSIDLASGESFPASDVPPWTLGVEEVECRIAHDSMGEVRVPATALYGAQTQRAVENFPIGNHSFQPEFIRAIALIKSCAARANGELGVMPKHIAAAITEVADRIAAGSYPDQFVVNVFQTGSGTSTNMNANEVIAHLSGTHPNDHVNRSQSSNDVIPSAIHIAAAREIHEELIPALGFLHTALDAKVREFGDVHKIGRTHLQDAVPMTLGQEFSGYAHQIHAAIERIQSATEGLFELPLGGTAIGTGLNAPAGFATRTIALIASRTGLPFREARNHFEAQSAKDAVLFLSGALRTCAVGLTKIADDIRWLASGPRAGLSEIRLPKLQPGSSIMPGKVNPVIAESVLMACAQVVGHDTAVSWSCARGNFELNTMMPLIAFDLLDSIELLAAVSRNFAARCISQVSADGERTGKLIEQSLAMATFLTPEIGYERAAAIAKEAFETGRTVREVAEQVSGLSPEKLDTLLQSGG